MKRLYQGRQLDAQDELEAITRRQQMTIVTYVAPDEPSRDWTMTIAAICIGVSVVGLVLSLVLTVVWP